MTIAATAWAFSTPAPQGPLERLLLILLADDTDEFGVCITDLDVIARTACLPRDGVEAALAVLEERGVLQTIDEPGEDDAEGGYSLYLISAWAERMAMPAGGHPDVGVIGRS